MPSTTQLCQHYWKIEDNHGKTSRGVCQHCGEIRDFTNYVEGIVFNVIEHRDPFESFIESLASEAEHRMGIR